MRERLKETLSGKQIGVHLSTFHALGVNMLRKSIHHLGYRPNFIIYDKNDQLSVIKTIMEDQDFDDTGIDRRKVSTLRNFPVKVNRGRPGSIS